jgi:hypothetical protein
LDAQGVSSSQHPDVLTRFNLRDEQVVGALEKDVDVDREVLVRVREHQEVEELRVVKEEEPVEREAFFFEVLVSLLLENEVVFCELDVHLSPVFDHQIVHRLWVSVGAPHYTTELGSRLEEVSLVVTEDIAKEA